MFSWHRTWNGTEGHPHGMHRNLSIGVRQALRPCASDRALCCTLWRCRRWLAQRFNAWHSLCETGISCSYRALWKHSISHTHTHTYIVQMYVVRPRIYLVNLTTKSTKLTSVVRFTTPTVLLTWDKRTGWFLDRPRRSTTLNSNHGLDQVLFRWRKCRSLAFDYVTSVCRWKSQVSSSGRSHVLNHESATQGEKEISCFNFSFVSILCNKFHTPTCIRLSVDLKVSHHLFSHLLISLWVVYS